MVSNGISNHIYAEPSGIANDRVRITITDSTGETKWLHLTPKEAHDFAVQVLESAAEAQGLDDFKVLIGIAYEAA